MTSSPEERDAGASPARARQSGFAYHPSQKRPRDAATLILLDRTGPEPKVLLGRRSERQVFAPGIFVFPGGKVERADGRMPALGRLAPHVERQLQTAVIRPSPTRARAYVLAAIRELAEETGLLFGCSHQPAPRPPSMDWHPFSECGVLPVLDDIWLIARSITPPGSIRRYDTRFFATDATRICHRLHGLVHADAELTDIRWVGLSQTPDYDLHPMTRLVLEELGNRLNIGLDRDVPVPFFRPRAGVMHRYDI